MAGAYSAGAGECAFEARSAGNGCATQAEGTRRAGVVQARLPIGEATSCWLSSDRRRNRRPSRVTTSASPSNVVQCDWVASLVRLSSTVRMGLGREDDALPSVAARLADRPEASMAGLAALGHNPRRHAGVSPLGKLHYGNAA